MYYTQAYTHFTFVYYVLCYSELETKLIWRYLNNVIKLKKLKFQPNGCK